MKTLRQIVSEAYVKSVDSIITENHKSPAPAWMFEERFAKEIAQYCADICLDLGTSVAGVAPIAPFDDCAYQIKKEFGICQ